MRALIRFILVRVTASCASAREFVHAPVDVRIVAVLRMGYAGLLLINVLCWWPDLDRWFSEEGVLTLAASRRTIDARCLTLFQLLPTDRATLRLVYALFLVQIVGLLVGCRPRLQAVCCFVWLVSFQHRNSLVFEGEDTLFRIFGFLLIFMPLGNVWSLDARLRARSGAPGLPMTVDGWSVRLMQFEMTMLYFSAAWSKLLGAPWRDGTALYYVTRLDEYWGRLPIPAFVFQTPWIVRSLTWSTMALEFTVPVLIWFAPTRRLALGMVLAFHLACDYAMHLFLFHWIMLAGWLAFLQPDDLGLIARLLRGKRVSPTLLAEKRYSSRGLK